MQNLALVSRSRQKLLTPPSANDGESILVDLVEQVAHGSPADNVAAKEDLITRILELEMQVRDMRHVLGYYAQGGHITVGDFLSIEDGQRAAAVLRRHSGRHP